VVYGVRVLRLLPIHCFRVVRVVRSHDEAQTPANP